MWKNMEGRVLEGEESKQNINTKLARWFLHQQGVVVIIKQNNEDSPARLTI